MRALLLPLLALAPFLAGCTSGPTTDLDCTKGPGDAFMKVVLTSKSPPSDRTPGLYVVGHDRVFTRVSALFSPGGGEIRRSAFNAANISNETITQVLKDFGWWRDDRNYTLQDTYRGTLDQPQWGQLCGTVSRGVYGLNAQYEGDCTSRSGVLTYNISTELNFTQVTSICDGGPSSLQGLRQAFFGIAQKIHERAFGSGVSPILPG